MEFLIGLAFSILGAWFCYFIAERNGMNRIGWPILGFLLPLLGIVITLIVAFVRQPQD